MRAVRVAPTVLAITLVACGEAAAPRGPGSLRISSSATVPEPFLLSSYGIAIDGGTPLLVPAAQNASLMVNGLAHGTHRVALTGLPAACSAGENTREVTLKGDDTVQVTFSIVCTRTTGDLRVTTITTGTDIDPDGYLVLLNQAPRAIIGANGVSMLSFVPAGTYAVALSGVATNCTGGAAQTVTVVAGAQATALFNVSCTAVAYIRVASSTSGTDPDPDGVTLRIGQGSPTRLRSGTSTLRAPTGSVSWTLGDIQPNCTLGGPTSGTATLAAGDTLTIDAAATCSAIGYGTATTVATDAAADTLANPQSSTARAHDVLQVTTRYATNWLILVMRFTRPVGGAGESNPAGLQGYIELDVDENTATGFPPAVNSFGGSSQQGVDYGLILFRATSSSVPLLKALGGDSTTHRVPLAIEGDSVIVRIPLAKLGGDDGNLSITSVVGTEDRPTDVVPNSGVILGRQPTGGAIAGDARGTERAGPMPATGKRSYEPRWPRK